MMMNSEPLWYLGFDPAELQDPSGFVALKKRADEVLEVAVVYRFPRGTAYSAQAQAVADVFASYDRAGGAVLTADATGLGLPVVEMIRERGVHVKAVVITSGEAEGKSGLSHTVPKAKLVGALMLAMQEGRFIVTDRSEAAEMLREELKAFVMKRRKSGYESFEADAGEHDDLVLATCLATWEASKNHVIHGVFEALRLQEKRDRNRDKLRRQ